MSHLHSLSYALQSFPFNTIDDDTTIYHNLNEVAPETNIVTEFDQWIHSTRDYSAKSFCAYVKTKHCGAVIMTQKEIDIKAVYKPMIKS